MTTATAWWILSYLGAESLGQRQRRKGLLSSAWGLESGLSDGRDSYRLTDIVKGWR